MTPPPGGITNTHPPHTLTSSLQYALPPSDKTPSRPLKYPLSPLRSYCRIRSPTVPPPYTSYPGTAPLPPYSPAPSQSPPTASTSYSGSVILIVTLRTVSSGTSLLLSYVINSILWTNVLLLLPHWSYIDQFT